MIHSEEDPIGELAAMSPHELETHLLEVLRESSTPLTTRGVAEQALRAVLVETRRPTVDELLAVMWQALEDA